MELYGGYGHPPPKKGGEGEGRGDRSESRRFHFFFYSANLYFLLSKSHRHTKQSVLFLLSVVYCLPMCMCRRSLSLALAFRPRGGLLLFKRAPYKQQAVENHSTICQIKTEPASWMDDSGSQFFFYLASARLAPIATLASTSFANPAFSYLAVVPVSALRGVQSPEGEKTEISLL
jgi:hypothetical protein